MFKTAASKVAQFFRIMFKLLLVVLSTLSASALIAVAGAFVAAAVAAVIALMFGGNPQAASWITAEIVGGIIFVGVAAISFAAIAMKWREYYKELQMEAALNNLNAKEPQ